MFADNCFEPLARVPFAKGAADRFVVLLDTLDRLACAFDADGVQTPEAQQIYENYFKSENALFSDSSEPEKSKFRNELTFPPPGRAGEILILHMAWQSISDDTAPALLVVSEVR